MVVKIRKNFCLTFDIEEFDIAKGITEEEAYEVSFEGTKRILNLLKEEGIRATFFITAKFATKYPELIREISKDHEVASHGYEHKHDYRKMEEAYEYIKKSKEILEKIIKKEVNGFRSPRMMEINPAIIKMAGFKYDSSLQPAPMAGRRLDIFKSRKIQKKEGLIIVPSSVNFLGFPLFWFGFRNMSLWETKYFITKFSFNKYRTTYFHSWEFTNIEKYNIESTMNLKVGPIIKKMIKSNTGEKLIEDLRKYIRWCKKEYDFITISEMIKRDYERAEAL